VVGPGIFYYLQRAERLVSSMRVMPLTSYLGDLGCASFSPDGSQVAFDWRASNKKNYDVYVRLVRRGNALQLTREQADSLLPTWSPDVFASDRSREWQIWTCDATDQIPSS
jgi:Tol biopolymer transport system component